MKNIISLFLLGIVLSSVVSAQELDYKPKILLVTAHPDDDTIFSGTVFKTTRLLGGAVDLALMTNGEGGYKYSILGRYVYNLELDKEEIGRQYLPAIRKKELMAGGEIMGIRNYFFFEEEDFYYTLDINETLEKWDSERVISRIADFIKREKYDFVFTMLPHSQTHGHHKASAVLAMRAIMTLPVEERPLALMTTGRRQNGQGSTFTLLEGFPLTEVDRSVSPFEFDRSQKFGFNDRLDYNIISNWIIAEHKSQGAMSMRFGGNRVEQYLYLKMNEGRGIEKLNTFFKAVKEADFPD